MNRLDFDGRTAVITGGAAGIGLAIAQRLMASGGKVSLWDRDPSALKSAQTVLGKATETCVVDVADVASVDAAAKATSSAFGRIDALVCSAGVAGLNATTWQYPVDEWQRVIGINLDGVFYCNRAIVPIMLERDYGRIVNIASIAGKEGNPRMAPYSATKAGVIGLTKSLGKELATDGICVNAVAPAVVQTQILDQLTPEQVAYMTDKIPMKRTGKPAEIAAVVHFLASPDCSFVTAQCYDASGGRATY